MESLSSAEESSWKCCAEHGRGIGAGIEELSSDSKSSGGLFENWCETQNIPKCALACDTSSFLFTERDSVSNLMSLIQCVEERVVVCGGVIHLESLHVAQKQ